ncbi:hypothetical protein RO1_22190 [Roseburia intestinalis XB6B4]|uniref:Uncharacterized protein n=1 Tax=Roseburia intestinalis XB6B4 TaxID=718255 RepID=D4KZD7_9FIRM|nr:hypothetical protein RO1_22190 [Roseburia intestinalis XB6B4]
MPGGITMSKKTKSKMNMKEKNQLKWGYFLSVRES